MYSKDKLINILMEYRHIVKVLSEVDNALQVAALIICKKYDMVLVLMNEDGSEVLLAEDRADQGIHIAIYEDIGIAVTGIQMINKELGKIKTYVWDNLIFKK